MSRQRNVRMVPISEERQIAAVDGTPLQQQWQVLNFHETRINKIEKYLGENDRSTEGEAVAEKHMALITNLIDDIKNLKSEIAELKKTSNKKALNLRE